MMNSLKFFVTKAAEDCRTPRRYRDFDACSTRVRDEFERVCITPPGFGVRQSSAAFARRNNHGLTLLEVLIVVTVIVIFVLLFIPASTGERANAVRIKCANNLKQIGGAFQVWAGDEYNDDFPMSVYTNKSGGPLYVRSWDLFRYFQVMSNELNNPAILTCPGDSIIPSTNFSIGFDSTHISYFLGLNAEDNRPKAFLVGDATITNGFAGKSGLLQLTTSQTFGWTKERHYEAGNIALADGSVQQLSQSDLRHALQKTGLATNLLLMPDKNSAK